MEVVEVVGWPLSICVVDSGAAKLCISFVITNDGSSNVEVIAPTKGEWEGERVGERKGDKEGDCKEVGFVSTSINAGFVGSVGIAVRGTVPVAPAMRAAAAAAAAFAIASLFSLLPIIMSMLCFFLDSSSCFLRFA
jgi:hypothetical protein